MICGATIFTEEGIRVCMLDEDPEHSNHIFVLEVDMCED